MSLYFRISQHVSGSGYHLQVSKEIKDIMVVIPGFKQVNYYKTQMYDEKHL